MLSLSPSDVLLDVIIRRVIFSAFTGALWLALALIVLNLFMIKNPAVRYVFFFLALAKGFFALVRQQPHVLSPRGTINVSFQAPGFGILPNFPDVGTDFVRGNSTLASGPGIVVLAAAGIFLFWRFLAFVRFQRIIGTAPEISRASNSTLFATLDCLVEQVRVPYPKMISVNSSDAPFTVGFKRPVIALSPALVDQLHDEEIEAVLAHEIAHVARRDYLFHWLLVVMRDVLFFSPVTYIVYPRLSFERERACDDFSTKFCARVTLAKSLIKVAEIREASPTVSLFKSFAPQSFLHKKSQSYFYRRVSELIEPRAYKPLTWRSRLLFWLSAAVFAYVEIHIVAIIRGSRVLFS